MPATGDGISVSTLSVETSSSGSSTSTWSPSALSQRVTVPSVTDSPSAGMVTVGAARRSSSEVPAAGGCSGDGLGRRRRAPDSGCCVLRGARLAGCSAACSSADVSLGGRLLGAAAGAVADDRQVGADRDGVVLADEDLLQGAGHRRRDLGVDLVGGDLEQRLVDLDGVADALQPAGHGAFGDRLPKGRHGHAFRHVVRSPRRAG